ncbi:MAG: NAD(P)/FAD-dependent oxidoreductase, partial [Anaerolineae bacterium]
MRPPLDVLVVGAGPGGLATAIKLKRLADEAGQELSMAVIDKASQPGYHNLSGAVLDPRPLDELSPGWREDRQLAKRVSPVEQDDIYFLLGSRAIKVPELVAPSAMDHGSDYIVSISRLVGYLASVAEAEGVEVYSGFSARQLIIEDGRVRGVRLGEVGLDADGGHMANYRPAEEIRSRVTVLADGTRGVLSEQLRDQFGAGRNPQVYSLGIKAVMQFRDEHPFGANRVAHFLGYPLPQDVFGGG